MRSWILEFLEFLWIVMWTPSCARCCWRRRSSINRRRGCACTTLRQTAVGSMRRQQQPGSCGLHRFCPLCARRQLQLASSCCPSPDIQGAVLRAAARRAAARRAATPHAATHCAAAAAGCRVFRPCGGRAHRSSASPAAPLLAARSGLSKASAAVYHAIKQAAREAFVDEARFCVRFAEFRIQCHNLVCKVFCQNSEFRFQVCVWRARVE